MTPMAKMLQERLQAMYAPKTQAQAITFSNPTPAAVTHSSGGAIMPTAPAAANAPAAPNAQSQQQQDQQNKIALAAKQLSTYRLNGGSQYTNPDDYLQNATAPKGDIPLIDFSKIEEEIRRVRGQQQAAGLF